jgi:hypothetical protein
MAILTMVSAVSGQHLIVFWQATQLIELGKRAFNDPTFWQLCKTMRVGPFGYRESW